MNKIYFLITQDFFKYLPSRFYILTNILLIIPLFSKMLSVKEMGIFQLGISILNLICTCLFDWVSKSTLRFYEKNKKAHTLSEFVNNIFALFFINYFILILLYFKFRHVICSSFYITESTLASIMIIVFPCLLRQFLYQILRLLKKSVLYTVSIIIYQIILVATTILLINNGIENVSSIFIAMTIAISLIDIYILSEIKMQTKLEFSLWNFSYIKKYLIYGIPLVLTNFAIWSFFHFNKYYFQKLGDLTSTGELALAYFITTSTLTATFSTLAFAVFPRIIKLFENKRAIDEFITAMTQIYFVFFIPLALVFCFFPQEILDIFTNNQYKETVFLLPFFAISIFIHELCKIINIKYHLKNLTIIETATTTFTGILCIALNLYFIKQQGIIGAAIAMTVSFLILALINISVNLKIKYINYKKVMKTFLKCLLICVFAYSITLPINLFSAATILVQIAKLLTYLLGYYLIIYYFFKKVVQ